MGDVCQPFHETFPQLGFYIVRFQDVGLLGGKPEFGFEVHNNKKTPRVTDPLGNRLCSSLRSHSRLQLGRHGLRCPPSQTRPQELHTRLTLFTWDLGRIILVWNLRSRMTSNRGSQRLSSKRDVGLL